MLLRHDGHSITAFVCVRSVARRNVETSRRSRNSIPKALNGLALHGLTADTALRSAGFRLTRQVWRRFEAIARPKLMIILDRLLEVQWPTTNSLVGTSEKSRGTSQGWGLEICRQAGVQGDELGPTRSVAIATPSDRCPLVASRPEQCVQSTAELPWQGPTTMVGWKSKEKPYYDNLFT